MNISVDQANQNPTDMYGPGRIVLRLTFNAQGEKLESRSSKWRKKQQL